MPLDDVKFNGRERAGAKRRVFVCRLTDGRLAVLPESQEEEMLCFSTVAELKQQILLLVPEIRIPVYEDYELNAVRQKLKGLSSATQAV